MPLTGAIQADFGELIDEANKASAALGVMDTEAKKTGQTLAKTGAQVDGFGAKAGKGGNALTQLTGGLRLVDSSLNAVGVNMSKPIGAIEELAAVSTKGVGALGALGTAGAVLAAAMAAWEFGKWSADLTGMNAVWDRIWESLGVNSIAAETAANRQEVLAKASQTAGREITDMTEAIRINYDAVRGHTAGVQTAIHRQAEWEREIRKHRAELPAMSAALENHTATVAQLATQYKMSEAAITYYVAKTKDKTAADTAAAAEATRHAEAMEKLKASMFGGDSITKANEMAAALGGVGNLSRMTTEEQAKLNAIVGTAIETYKRWGETAPASLNAIYTATASIGTVTTGLGAEWANVGTQVTVTADAIVADLQRIRGESAAYEAETQRVVDEAQRIKPPIQAAKEETQQFTLAMRDLAGAAKLTVHELLQAGMASDEAYRKAGLFVNDIGAGGTARYKSAVAAGVMLPTDTGDVGRAMRGETAGERWGTGQGSTLTVNVASTEAGAIATKLVDEMRRTGVRF